MDTRREHGDEIQGDLEPASSKQRRVDDEHIAMFVEVNSPAPRMCKLLISGDD